MANTKTSQQTVDSTVTKKTTEQLLIEQYGFVTPTMLNGYCVTLKQDPLADMCYVDGKLHSDVQLLQLASKDAGLMSLIDQRFTPRGTTINQRSDDPVGGRHVSLAQAFANANRLNSDLDSQSKDAISQFDKLVNANTTSPAPDNSGNQPTA